MYPTHPSNRCIYYRKTAFFSLGITTWVGLMGELGEIIPGLACA
jgi:hypothetical protein